MPESPAQEDEFRKEKFFPMLSDEEIGSLAQLSYSQKNIEAQWYLTKSTR